MLTNLTPKAVFLVFVWGIFLVVDHSCAYDGERNAAVSERHKAAMRDWGKADQVPVRTPWGDALDGKE